MTTDSGPYLSAAFICEKGLLETDGVNSFIRVVDRWTVTGPSDVMPQTPIQMTLVVSFKSGIHRGPGQLVITPNTPSDSLMPAINVPVLFEGDEDRGIMLVIPMAFPAIEPGVYWFKVELDGRKFTEVPLRIVYHRVVPMAPPTNPSHGPQP